MIALLATVLPNVGPIDVEEKFLVCSLLSSAERTFFSPSGVSVLVETW